MYVSCYAKISAALPDKISYIISFYGGTVLMKARDDRSVIRTCIPIITYAVLLVMFLVKIESVADIAKRLWKIFSPFIYGFIFAYIVNMPMNFIETCIFDKMKKHRIVNNKLKRILALTIAFFLAISVVCAVFSILLPQLAESVMMLVNNFDSYYAQAEKIAYRIIDKLNLNIDLWTEIENIVYNNLEKIIASINTALPQIIDRTKAFTTNLIGVITDAFIGLVVCIYMLYNKEKLLRQSKKLLYAFIPKKISDTILDIASFTNATFTKFIAGQIIESFVLGILCFIGMSILDIQYELLISVIIGIGNLIPIFGPIIATIPCALILLVINPVKTLWFVIFVIVLQQFEGNLIYPKVVGKSIGLSGLWVIFAIVVGGGLFGLPGIFLGVPTFAVIYRIFGNYISRRAAHNIAKADADDGDKIT